MADINERLRNAAGAGLVAKLKALLSDPGCDALSRDLNGSTALIWAAGSGHEACVELLLPVSDASAKSESGVTPLMCAAMNGHESCTRLLLPASNALATDKSGMTALMYAAWAGHESCVGLLLPVSDVRSKSKTSQAASDWARVANHKNLAQFIDAYVLSQSERLSLGDTVGLVPPRERAGRRV